MVMLKAAAAAWLPSRKEACGVLPFQKHATLALLRWRHVKQHDNDESWSRAAVDVRMSDANHEPFAC